MKPGTHQIAWGSYNGLEGPYFKGSASLVEYLKNRPKRKVPLKKDIPRAYKEVLIETLAATEGGRFDAVNMYDAGILSIGIRQDTVQSGNAQRLLAELVKKGGNASTDFYSLLEERGYDFKPGYGFIYNFHNRGNNSPVVSSKDLRKMLLGCDGTRGSWGIQKDKGPLAIRAKEIAKEVAGLLSKSQETLDIQYEFAVDGATGFFTEYAKQNLIDPLKEGGPRTVGEAQKDHCLAAIALYGSFAANNPLIADKMLRAHLEAENLKRPFTDEWLKKLAARMTFGPAIAIYPHRYDAIRPVIERHYNVNLPDYAAQLRADARDYTVAGFDLTTTKGVQAALEAIGYNPGPIDGIEGNLTRNAIMGFQKDNRLEVDGRFGFNTREAMMQALKETLQ